ncbi:putative mitochondrial protein [Sesamum angolense]|uniref:Mitochondrial protein n=1 Tax=Sesamum angolense TaxID=2727404 RepID=A0AAE1W3S0_9LAMI|nr:putative mitochondrial protein [Sesamum angolense]
MSTLCWNCQGLGGLGKLRELENLVRTHHPSLVFLAETKCNNKRIEYIKQKLDWFGLVLVCLRKVKVGASLYFGISRSPFSFSPFQITISMPQFNMMMIGIVGVLRASMAPLRQGIVFLHGLSYPGFRLNLVVLGFVQMFPETTATHLDSALSDHVPILISITGFVVTPVTLSRPWRLRDEGGRWIDDPAALRRLIERHFSRVFASDQPSTIKIERGMEHLACRIDCVTAQALAQPFTKEEVVRALFQMAPLKSPGPDGMPPLFFQRFWSSVQGDVVPCVLALLNNHVMPRSLNDTHIVLIPKCRKPESLSQCRPISLCNVLYKIASKSIANRLKLFLETIISPTQTAFVPGRLITDNILVAYEFNHFMRNKNWGKMGHMALKLDISKAYDKVEWNFFKHVLLRLGFPPRLVDLIMLCISSVRYSFLINGHEFGSLTPNGAYVRGTRCPRTCFSYVQRFSAPWLDKLCARLVEGELGFREFRAFNQAMLAKQCWRVFTNPHSLLGRLLNARYFPHSSFLDAPLSLRPSLTWRSLLSARPLMMAGIRWCVGSGSSIKVWASPWIPRPSSFHPITPVATNDPNLLISTLIDHELGIWRHDRLRDLFLPVDVEAILKIPLRRTSQSNLAVWHYSADGRFSVRSVYHLAWSMRQALSHIRWEVISNLGVSVEDWFRQVWRALPEANFCLFLMLCWGLWKNKNGNLMQNDKKPPHEIVRGVSRFLADFQKASCFGFSKQVSEVNRRWSLPRRGWVKINFDAATFANGTESGWGVVARSNSGQCLAWASCHLAWSYTHYA